MGKRRKVPEDLMGTILNEGSETADEERTFSRFHGSPDAEREAGSLSTTGEDDAISWEERPERVGVAFNLSKQVSVELERLRRGLRLEDDVRPSRSEIAEVVLRIAVEDVRRRGEESELVKRLGGWRVDRTADTTVEANDAATKTTRLSVDEDGFILKTTYDEDGGIMDEDVVAAVADLPVVEEYMDDQGRLVSRAQDDSGNTFEQIMDEDFNTLETRLISSTD